MSFKIHYLENDQDRFAVLTGLTNKQRLLKRLFDVFVSGLVVVFILIWIIPIVGLIIVMSSPGPFLFVQSRAGRNGRVFPYLIFRTNKSLPSNTTSEKFINKLTPIGRFLKLTGLYKIPLFLSVLAGHMSIVGPIPQPLSSDSENSNTPGYKNRYLVKPGIISYTSIRRVNSIRDLVKMDVNYIKHYSFSLDIGIFLATWLYMLEPIESRGPLPKDHPLNKEAFPVETPISEQSIDIESILAVAAGGGILLGSVLGLWGAFFGLLAGGLLSYLSQVLNMFEKTFPKKGLVESTSH